MAFHVKDPATDRAVRRLAKLKRTTLTAAIRDAVEEEYRRARNTEPFMERIRAIQDDAERLRRPGGKPADKAFYDELSGNT